MSAVLQQMLYILFYLFCRDERQLIESYFWDGYRYQQITRFLGEYHGINISVTTLRRRLRDYGLSRRCQYPPLTTVYNIISEELRGPG